MTQSRIDLCATDPDRIADPVRVNAGRRGETRIAGPTSCRVGAIPGPRIREPESGTRRGAPGPSWSGSRRGAAAASRLCPDAKRKEMSQ